MSPVDRADAHVVVTTAICARWQGCSTDHIVDDIDAGFLVANDLNGRSARANYRIYFEDYVAYLQRMRWSRVPKDADELFRVAGRRAGEGVTA